MAGPGGTNMAHFKDEHWIDFVNETLTTEKQAATQRHLDAGCGPCSASVALWQKVQKAGIAERSYLPPSGAVRAVKAAFEASGRARNKKLVGAFETLFDSLRQPALAGARSATGQVRRVLYRADPYQIDVQLEGTPSGKRVIITGQVIDVNHALTVGRQISVVLSNGRGHVARTVTNEHGEFEAVLEDSDGIELSFVGSDYRPMVISLKDALGRKTGGAR